MSGYIRLYRGWRECDVFGDEPYTERDAWLWLLEHAAWKPMTRTNLKGERFRIERGQMHVSLRSLEKVWGWGKNKVARYLQRLSDHEMVGTASGQSGTFITILNYSKYQDDRDSRDEETGTASGQSRDIQEEGKEGKEEKGKPRKRERTPDFEIPDWVPPEPWAAFVEMRKRLKAPVDSYIANRLFSKLEAIAADGWDIAKVLDKATLNNWKDVYAPTPGRDDDLRVMSPASIAAGPFDMDEYRARIARLDQRGFTPDPRHAEPDRPRTTGPPRPIGQLVAGIAGSVQH